MSRRVKKTRKQLDAIVDNHHKFSLSVDHNLISRRREETCSYVYAPDIIGREDDQKAIVDKLLDPNVSDDVSFLTIVGVGGLGKTALAQLVFDDENVKKEFPSRLWVCVSDQGGESFNIRAILGKILEVATGSKLDNASAFELVQRKFQEQLRGKKYLLVLDDVWNEDREKWLNLRKFLVTGQSGSSVVVTTRSQKTAQVICEEHSTYELKGLSAENSWRLFEMTAFDKRLEQANHPEFVKIGKNIVRKCSNVPLAIRVVGSLLFGQDESKWRSFEESDLAKISQDKNEIMSILKLSYDNLEPSLKSCFSYCALFPKDYIIHKEMLIRLWMAQGYVVPFHGVQGIEDAAEEHFLILLRRCFFHDVKKDELGDVISCKMHDLMHDVSQEVAKNEICVANSMTNKSGAKVRHLFHYEGVCTESSFRKMKIRSYLQPSFHFLTSSVTSSWVGKLVSNWTCLRALDLHGLGIKSLSYSIGQLLHLRYLDLSRNHELQKLCGSVTKLRNLQTLKLRNCYMLKELPKDLSKLVELRHLDIEGCYGLSYMPSDMDKLSSLCVLTRFVVAESNSSRKQCVGRPEDLGALEKIKGHISFSIPANPTNVSKQNSDRGCLRCMQRLKKVSIHFANDPTMLPSLDSDAENHDIISINHEAFMEKLEPHPNLKALEMKGYRGATIPRWGRHESWVTALRKLVKIELNGCPRLQHLTSLSGLTSLKLLQLRNLANLEYVENTSGCSSSNSSNCGVVESPLLPSLELLRLENLPNLKGWWREAGLVKTCSNSNNSSNSNIWEPSFPHLSDLYMGDCPNLTSSFPLCPRVETLEFYRSNERLKIRVGEDHETGFVSSSCSKPTVVLIDNFHCLKSLSIACLTSLHIFHYFGMESLLEVGEVFKSYSSLQYLRLDGCPNLTFPEEDGGMPWRPLHQSLHSLELSRLPRLEILPKGMRYLTSLQTLNISDCDNLRALPQWISCLSSLQSLYITDCESLTSLPEAMRNLTSLQRLEISDPNSELEKRCQNHNGEDWPNIQHIATIKIII